MAENIALVVMKNGACLSVSTHMTALGAKIVAARVAQEFQVVGQLRWREDKVIRDCRAVADELTFHVRRIHDR